MAPEHVREMLAAERPKRARNKMGTQNDGPCRRKVADATFTQGLRPSPQFMTVTKPYMKPGLSPVWRMK